MADGIIGSLNELGELGLFSHNDPMAVRKIREPGHATAWLVACAIDIETDVIPPTFDAALESRIGNISDCFEFLEDLHDADQLRPIWEKARKDSRSMPAAELDAIRMHIRQLHSLNETRKRHPD